MLEGVYLDRTAQGLKPRFLKGEPPSDADITAVVQKISRRVIRKLWQFGYLEQVDTGDVRANPGGLDVSPQLPVDTCGEMA